MTSKKPKMTPTVSLIIPTLGRTNKVQRLLDSLLLQTNQDFEVIIVDQSNDNHLAPIINKYQADLSLTHVREQKKGANRARNIGIQYSSSEIILWPDDDCWYPENVIESVIEIYKKYPNANGMAGMLIDTVTGRHSRWFPRKTKRMSLLQAFCFGNEPVISFKKAALDMIGGFGDTIGLGMSSEWGAGEGTDLIVRALKNQQVILITPNYSVFHPIESSKTSNLQKTISYSKGMGAVISNNHLNLLFRLRYLLTIVRSILWSLCRLNFKETKFHTIRLIYTIYGIQNFKNS